MPYTARNNLKSPQHKFISFIIYVLLYLLVLSQFSCKKAPSSAAKNCREQQKISCPGTTTCIDINSDALNCGTCGHICPSHAQHCSGGACFQCTKKSDCHDTQSCNNLHRCVDCTEDSDCTSKVCDTSTFKCVDCLDNSTCNSGLCENNTCTKCQSDPHIRIGTDKGCTPDLPICNNKTECVLCTKDANCNGSVCLKHSSNPSEFKCAFCDSTTNNGCPNPSQDPSKYCLRDESCVDCLDNSDCPLTETETDKRFCFNEHVEAKFRNYTCHKCQPSTMNSGSDNGCDTAKPHCIDMDAKQYHCVQCAIDKNCPHEDDYCVNNKCIECRNNNDCSQKPDNKHICGENTNSCVAFGDKDTIIWQNVDGTVWTKYADNATCLPPLHSKEHVECIHGFASSPAISSDGSWLYHGSTDHSIYKRRTLDGSYQWKLATNDRVVSSPSLSQDGSHLFIGSNDSYFYAINTPDGSYDKIIVYGNIVSAPAIFEEMQPNGKYEVKWVAVTSTMSWIWFMNIPNQLNHDAYALVPVTTLPLPQGLRSSPIISADGSSLYVSGYPEVLWSFDTTDISKALLPNATSIISPHNKTRDNSMATNEDATLWSTPSLCDDGSTLLVGGSPWHPTYAFDTMKSNTLPIKWSVDMSNKNLASFVCKNNEKRYSTSSMSTIAYTWSINNPSENESKYYYEEANDSQAKHWRTPPGEPPSGTWYRDHPYHSGNTTFYATPVLGSNDILYAGDAHGNITAFNNSDGSIIGTLRATDSNCSGLRAHLNMATSPHINGDGAVLYVACDNQIMAIKTSSTGVADGWPMFMQNQRNSGRAGEN